jgi:DNA-binding MarR family transcriptional regulator/L-amino acid N-acyltransferase YncA
MTGPDLMRTVEAVRRFNRFYARHGGGLHQRRHKSPYSTAETRVFHELAHGRAKTAAKVARKLDLDTGYLSRLLARFERSGFIERHPNPADSRQHFVRLTPSGRAEVDSIASGSVDEVSAALGDLAREARAQLVSSMADVERLLSPPVDGERMVLRMPQRGDFGWIVERCAQFDHTGWHAEARAAEVVARLLGAGQPDASRAACWIAEQDCGARIGAAVVMPASETQARIELLFVEPGARRRGLGTRLVSSCAAFASSSRYENLSCCIDDAHADLREFVERAGFTPSGDAPAGRVWRLSAGSLHAS